MKKRGSKGRPDQRKGKKVSGGHFFVRGRIHSLINAPGTGVGRRKSFAAEPQKSIVVEISKMYTIGSRRLAAPSFQKKFYALAKNPRRGIFFFLRIVAIATKL